MIPPGLDIYQRFEIEVRTPKKRLLVDAFLPPAESLPSTVAPPPPPPLPATSPEEAAFLARLEERGAAAEPPPPPRRKKPGTDNKKAARAAQRPKTLEEEVQEFMNSGRQALVPNDDSDPS